MTRDQVFLAALTGILASGNWEDDDAIKKATSMADKLITEGGVVVIFSGKDRNIDALVRCDDPVDCSKVFHKWCDQNEESPHSKSFAWRALNNIIM